MDWIQPVYALRLQRFLHFHTRDGHAEFETEQRRTEEQREVCV